MVGSLCGFYVFLAVYPCVSAMSDASSLSCNMIGLKKKTPFSSFPSEENRQSSIVVTTTGASHAHHVVASAPANFPSRTFPRL